MAQVLQQHHNLSSAKNRLYLAKNKHRTDTNLRSSYTKPIAHLNSDLCAVSPSKQIPKHTQKLTFTSPPKCYDSQTHVVLSNSIDLKNSR